MIDLHLVCKINDPKYRQAEAFDDFDEEDENEEDFDEEDEARRRALAWQHYEIESHYHELRAVSIHPQLKQNVFFKVS